MRLCGPGDAVNLATVRTSGPSKEPTLNDQRSGYNAEQAERLSKIHARLVEARRELDALIGDAYLRPRASIVPVHFLDLASAVEKLRWAEKEWRELDLQATEADPSEGPDATSRSDDEEDLEEPVLQTTGAPTE